MQGSLNAVLEFGGLFLCASVVALLLPDAYLIFVHLRRSESELRREQEAPRLRVWPQVCVQLAVFNEPLHVEAAIDALCNLDWPQRQLEILVLDDSTDETSTLANARILYWQEKGIRIEHIKRLVRTEFKAGALANAFERTKAPFIAVFDADYRPPRSFLQLTLGVLVAEPRVAFVQARLDFQNRERNGLTRAQALELDTFLAYEQAARNWAGIPMTFNGTCGVWRREAIRDAGGWSGRSLVEDQDLSFRAFAKGWGCRNLVTVAARGELPETLSVLAGQRARWGAGTAQAFYGLPWQLLRHLKWNQAIVFILLAAFYATLSVLLVTILVITLVTWLLEPARGLVVAYGLLSVLTLLVAIKSTGAVLATRVLQRPLGSCFIPDLIRMWLMEAVLLPLVATSLLRGYLTRNLPFKRTPKTGH